MTRFIEQDRETIGYLRCLIDLIERGEKTGEPSLREAAYHLNMQRQQGEADK